jgi:hypothetical protein
MSKSLDRVRAIRTAAEKRAINRAAGNPAPVRVEHKGPRGEVPLDRVACPRSNHPCAKVALERASRGGEGSSS